MKKCPLHLKHSQEPDWKFNPRQLRMGIKTEMEHTYCPKIAKAISKAHLVEKRNYYTLLNKAGL